MKQQTLDGLITATRKYLRVEHPKLEFDDEMIEAKLIVLYAKIHKEIEDLDAKLIRHRISVPLEEFDFTMEIEKIGLHSGYCIHINQDKHLIASWTEERAAFD